MPPVSFTLFPICVSIPYKSVAFMKFLPSNWSSRVYFMILTVLALLPYFSVSFVTILSYSLDLVWLNFEVEDKGWATSEKFDMSLNWLASKL